MGTLGVEVVVVWQGHGRADLREDAAGIWAQATAHRDGDKRAGPVADARPLIDAVLDSSSASILLVAVEKASGTTVGFAAISTNAHGMVEVRYVGVRSDAWGHGVASALMNALPSVLASGGFSRAVLSVYADNKRAVAAYRRAGWIAIGEPTRHARTGRLEQRYRIELGAP